MFLLALALPVGVMAQTTSVMDLLLDTAESGNVTFYGSVISVAPDATTYSVTRLPGGADCSDVRGTRSVVMVRI